MNRPGDTLLGMSDLAAALASPSLVAQDARAIVAALAAEDDPTLRERADRILDRVAKIEEAIALLMDDDVEDMPLPPPAGVTNAITAAQSPPFAKKAPPFAKKDEEKDEPADDTDVEDAEMPPEKGDAPKLPSPGDVPEAPGTPPKAPTAAGDAPPSGVPDVENVADLHNAIRSFGKAKDRVAAKKYIKERARELGAEDSLPDSWE